MIKWMFDVKVANRFTCNGLRERLETKFAM